MRLTFIVKASTKVGFGHLIRSRSLFESICESNLHQGQIRFLAIGNQSLSRLLGNDTQLYGIYGSEKALIEAIEHNDEQTGDIVIFDMLSIGRNLYKHFASATLKVSLSPIFSHIEKMDMLFHRTRYYSNDSVATDKLFSGLEYTIIQKNCRAIALSQYKSVLEENQLSIAITMGGGDAANKTLRLLKRLNTLEKPMTIWVMLGEGYKHSYDQLIETSKNSVHEIILAKTNESMWRVLQQTALLIVPGGVTSYEAAFAGLPTINVIENTDRKYLVQELLDNKVAICVDDLFGSELLDQLLLMEDNRSLLLDMHINCKGLIDGKASDRIYESILTHYRQITRLDTSS